MDKNEIGHLYEKHAQAVYRLALGYLHDPHEAEDICHSVFLQLLSKNVQLFPGREKAYLLTCTANACKNHLKSFWRRHVQELDESIVFADAHERDLWAAVGALAPKYRVLIHLYYYEGYRQDEIAEILKISRTAVQTRMSRAKEKLRKELSEFE